MARNRTSRRTQITHFLPKKAKSPIGESMKKKFIEFGQEMGYLGCLTCRSISNQQCYHVLAEFLYNTNLGIS